MLGIYITGEISKNGRGNQVRDLLLCSESWSKRIFIDFWLIFIDFSFFAKNLDFRHENSKFDLGRKNICQNAPRIRILHDKLHRFARFSASNSVSNPFSWRSKVGPTLLSKILESEASQWVLDDYQDWPVNSSFMVVVRAKLYHKNGVEGELDDENWGKLHYFARNIWIWGTLSHVALVLGHICY